MKDEVTTVTEYARLTTEKEKKESLSCRHISVETYDALRRLNERGPRGRSPAFQSISPSAVALSSYVGILAGYGGTPIEILPKVARDADGDAERLRALLIRMLDLVCGLSALRGGEASLRRLKKPLTAWVADQFLLRLQQLVMHGLCFDYEQKQEVSTFLRGKMDLSRQIVLPPHRRHLFEVRHETFSPNRPEHRLFRLALDRCCRCALPIDNSALLHSLSDRLRDVPASRNAREDFLAWKKSRYMRQYESIRPWCELVLSEYMPYAVRGEQEGISALFPMERLFERYVAAMLRKMKKPGVVVETQSGRHSLCTMKSDDAGRRDDFFLLKPDILLHRGGERLFVADTKWKMLDGTKNFGLSQGDFYQMFAYGQKYLDGRGDMALVYPLHGDFPVMKHPFEFSSELRLWVVGYNLDEDCLSVPKECPLGEYLQEQYLFPEG